MNERIENCLAKELAHIFTVLPGIKWGKKQSDYDEKIRWVRKDLRSGKGKIYLDALNTLIKDNDTQYRDFHRFYVRGIQELLASALRHNVLTGPTNTITKVNHEIESINVFDQYPAPLERLEWANITNMPYYYYLKYGLERLNNDIKKFYPNGRVELGRDYFIPDFMREQYLWRSSKYMIFWPLMPTVLVYNGYPGVYNKGPNGDMPRL